MMLISEMISVFEKIKSEYGDLDVLVASYLQNGELTEPDIDVVRTSKRKPIFKVSRQGVKRVVIG